MKPTHLSGVTACVAASLLTLSAAAQKPVVETPNRYVGQIIIVSGSYCPDGTLLADGALRKVADDETLFSVIGNLYGGDGINTFALPDLRGRIPVGSGPFNNSTFDEGRTGGAAQALLAKVPPHNHGGRLNAHSAYVSTNTPDNNAFGIFRGPLTIYRDGNDPDVEMKTGSVQVYPVGGGMPVPTLSPILGVTFCISNTGYFPSVN
jgi:microcystin-dependent protein